MIGTGRKGLVLLLFKLGMRETLNVMVGLYFSLLLSGFLIISKPKLGWDSRLRFPAWSLVTIKTLPFLWFYVGDAYVVRAIDRFVKSVEQETLTLI